MKFYIKVFLSFEKWILDEMKMDIYNYVSIPQIAHDYFIKRGCFDDVKKLSGVPRAFIQGAVVGGRTMCANNLKCKTECKMNDFDAVSLYPSDMRR